ncbi:MAG: GHMP family kinase ATP-binding protein [Planctomycetaceae bacterium]
MIISRTPYRVSFFGGGTDYPAWYREHGGAVLAGAIDKYCFLTCRYLPPFFEHRTRVVYSKIEHCRTNGEIAHPAVRGVLGWLGIERGLELHCVADLPARSGIGSSSTFVVGLLHALRALEGRMPGKRQLALEAIEIEQNVLSETVGSQDQVLAAYGGLNLVEFRRNGEIAVHPLPLSPARLDEMQAHLMLFYTGIARTASDVAQSYVVDMAARAQQLQRLRRFVDQGLDILQGGGDLSAFGELLHAGWQAKRSLSRQVSNTQIDELYAAGCEAGALGGKLLGAGGGGFLLLFVPPERQALVRGALSHLIHVPFDFDFSGAQIVFCDRGRDYSEVELQRERYPTAEFRELPLSRAA